MKTNKRPKYPPAYTFRGSIRLKRWFPTRFKARSTSAVHFPPPRITTRFPQFPLVFFGEKYSYRGRSAGNRWSKCFGLNPKSITWARGFKLAGLTDSFCPRYASLRVIGRHAPDDWTKWLRGHGVGQWRLEIATKNGSYIIHAYRRGPGLFVWPRGGAGTSRIGRQELDLRRATCASVKTGSRCKLPFCVHTSNDPAEILYTHTHPYSVRRQWNGITFKY